MLYWWRLDFQSHRYLYFKTLIVMRISEFKLQALDLPAGIHTKLNDHRKLHVNIRSRDTFISLATHLGHMTFRSRGKLDKRSLVPHDTCNWHLPTWCWRILSQQHGHDWLAPCGTILLWCLRPWGKPSNPVDTILEALMVLPNDCSRAYWPQIDLNLKPRSAQVPYVNESGSLYW